jgi:hypothetical protein
MKRKIVLRHDTKCILPAKISVTMDKNRITQLWTVKCWGPTTGLLHNPMGCFQGGGGSVKQLGIGGVHSARLNGWGESQGGGIADIKKTQDYILSVFSIWLNPVKS